MQAVFVVGVKAETDASVLDSYAMDVLCRILAEWLSFGPDVSILVLLPIADAKLLKQQKRC